ncbi:MAG: hypothetical protein NT162_00620 [Candidatus Woesebacteria bacterium]|nr:hypothetical protein [Candidatus Woesebacteria bacterium]
MYKERRYGRDVFRESREREMLRVLSETGGLATAEQMEEARRRGNTKAIERVGNRSEKAFDEFAFRSCIIKSVINPGPLSDVYDAIDRWILFVDGFNLPPLPVQIKSSQRGVQEFKQGNPNQNIRPNYSFKKLHGLILVLNCGPSSNLDIFDKQLRVEAGRIINAISKDPSSTKHLTDITPKKLKDSNSFKIHR